METFLSVLVTIGYILICVFLFSLSIAIHEFGHFIAALKLGYRVERFSIGFGPAIWKKTIKGVEYRFSWIPLGGYVSIPDVDPEGTKAIEGTSSAKRVTMPAWKDFVVAIAGPMMNIVLAVILAIILYFAPGARFGTLPAVIGGVYEDSPAEKGGLKEGDKVLSVGGNEVDSWYEMLTEVQLASGKETEFKVLRDGQEVTLNITPERKENSVTYIGALSDPGENYAMWMPSRNIVDQVAWDAGAVFRALKGLVTPNEAKATANAVGGPVTIARGTYYSIRNDTWDGLGFLRFINTNLAIMNLLPIPVLDGGLILFCLIAMIFRRRVPEKFITAVSTFFMYVLMALMLFLVGRDFWRIGDTSKPVNFGNVRKAESACIAAAPNVQSDKTQTNGINDVVAPKSIEQGKNSDVVDNNDTTNAVEKVDASKN